MHKFKIASNTSIVLFAGMYPVPESAYIPELLTVIDCLGITIRRGSLISVIDTTAIFTVAVAVSAYIGKLIHADTQKIEIIKLNIFFIWISPFINYLLSVQPLFVNSAVISAAVSRLYVSADTFILNVPVLPFALCKLFARL